MTATTAHIEEITMKKDTTIAPPTSAALEQLKEARHTLTMRREALRQEYQRTCAKLRTRPQPVLHPWPGFIAAVAATRQGSPP